MVTRPRYFRVPAGALLALCMLGATVGQAAETPGGTPEYRVRAGDKLTVSVWKEQELQRQVLVQPDGKISFPLAGQVQAQGKTVEEIRADITTRLARYIPDLVVTVLVDEIRGARVYVLGQVNKANQYVVQDDIDVMQALSMAGGMTAFASPNDIKILRRDGMRQVALPTSATATCREAGIEQNIVLRDGDVVVVLMCHPASRLLRACPTFVGGSLAYLAYSVPLAQQPASSRSCGPDMTTPITRTSRRATRRLSRPMADGTLGSI